MKYVYTVVIMFALLATVGCDDRVSTADDQQREQTAQLMNEAQRQIGMPEIVNFQQRKLMKMIYELCDKEDLVCYAYIKSDYKGELIFIGRCIGFGIPFSAQFTNPERLTRSTIGGEFHTIPQPDPNGLFMPTSSSATWLMMVDPKTQKARPVYLEPEIVVSPFPLH